MSASFFHDLIQNYFRSVGREIGKADKDLNIHYVS